MSHQHSKEQDDNKLGTLYVVATPIGNLADITDRAITTLKQVDCILCEDTRHSKRLLNHYGINNRLRSCHEHNEADQIEWVCEFLLSGQSLALISDAGTPLISDPGFVLVRALRDENLPVAVIPGPSSIISALSVAGLPTDRFVYDGFLPSKNSARNVALKQYESEVRTIVLLESSHRIVACIASIVEVLGPIREIVVARELTKKFETVISGNAQAVLENFHQDDNQSRGEFVVMIKGVPNKLNNDEIATSLRSVLAVLVPELPVKQAAGLAAKITGVRKNEAYTIAQQLKDER